MLDSYIHKGLRKKLVELLKRKGIKDELILRGFYDIPRHFFIDSAFSDWAYKDVPFKIAASQTISQPYTVAMMTELLGIKKGDKVLEVGTGSGFQACMLSYCGAKVYSIERHAILSKSAGLLMEKLGYKEIRLLVGDGYEGSPRFAPFDKIIVTAGATELPRILIGQLKVGGIMVVPVGENEDSQDMLRITKTSDSELYQENFGSFKFVPFVSGFNAE
jgi:protein-L-isoaspartate(D-aspartate) O-methyltransferase